MKKEARMSVPEPGGRGRGEQERKREGAVNIRTCLLRATIGTLSSKQKQGLAKP